MTGRRSLDHLRVATTRPVLPYGERDPLVGALERCGAGVIEVPLTRIERADPGPLLSALRDQPQWDWIIFTSATTVRLLLSEAADVDSEWSLARLGLHETASRARLAAIGATTAKVLAAHGLTASLVPERYSQEGLLESFDAMAASLRDTRVLYPAAEDARELLGDGLRAQGADVTEVTVYRSVPDRDAAARLAGALGDGEVDVVTLMAPSAADALAAAMPAGSAPVPVASIGSVTTRAARDAGFDVVAEASPSTVDGLVSAIQRWRSS